MLSVSISTRGHSRQRQAQGGEHRKPSLPQSNTKGQAGQAGHPVGDAVTGAPASPPGFRGRPQPRKESGGRSFSVGHGRGSPRWPENR